MSKKSNSAKSRRNKKSKPKDSEIKHREGYVSMIIKERVNQIWRWDNLEDASDEIFGKKS